MPTSHYRRGWIGNESTPDFEIGSKLWLFEQARLTRSVLNGINSVAKKGLKWLIEDNIEISIEVNSSLGENNNITIEKLIKRPRYRDKRRKLELWTKTGK